MVWFPMLDHDPLFVAEFTGPNKQLLINFHLNLIFKPMVMELEYLQLNKCRQSIQVSYPERYSHLQKQQLLYNNVPTKTHSHTYTLAEKNVCASPSNDQGYAVRLIEIYVSAATDQLLIIDCPVPESVEVLLLEITFGSPKGKAGHYLLQFRFESFCSVAALYISSL